MPGPRPVLAEDQPGLLREDRRHPALVRRGVRHVGQPGDSGHQRAEDHALDHQHLAGVEALGRPERADRVGHRLDAGQRGTAVGERPEQHEDHGDRDQAFVAGSTRVHAGRGVIERQRAERLADQARDDHENNDAGEQVGRHRERPPGLPDAPQVPVAHQDHDDDRDRGQLVRPDVLVNAGRQRRCDRGRARRDLHRDGDHVVDKQCHRGDLGHLGAEVFPRDHVGAAGPGVDRDHLAVRQHHQSHHEQDDAGQRQDEDECRGRQAALDQLDQDFLGAVRGGGNAVR